MKFTIPITRKNGNAGEARYLFRASIVYTYHEFINVGSKRDHEKKPKLFRISLSRSGGDLFSY
jgi:hypothetical protein